MIPEGWDIVTAQELCHSISVGIVIKPSQYYVNNESGVRAFRSANVKEGRIDDSNWVYLSKEGHEKNKKSILKKDDVLIVRTGYPGTACLVTKEFEGSNAIDIVIARPDEEKILPEYLCSFTNSEYGKSQVLNLQGGMAQKHLNVGAYQKLLIKLPPIDEQQKISEILSTWDKAIATTENLIKNRQQQKKALMQQLLTGKKRLPGFEGEWNKKRLSDIVKVSSDKSTKNNQYPIVTSARKGIFLQSDYFKKQVASEDNAGYKIVPRGFVTFRSMSDDGVFVFNKQNLVDVAIISPAYGVFEFAGINGSFALRLLNGPMMMREVKKFSQGGTRIALKTNAFNDIYLNVPELSEQIAIARVVDCADKEIGFLKKKHFLLQKEKKALMQQLLAGKKRVKV